MKRLLLISLIGLIIACGGSSDETSDQDGTTDGDDNSGATLEATLSGIQSNIFTPTCARSGCHSSTSASAGLSLADGESFSSLVGVPSSQLDSMNRVEPADTSQSYLIHKLEGTQATVGGSGSQMPRGESPLSDEELQAIKDWINEGAQNN